MEEETITKRLTRKEKRLLRRQGKNPENIQEKLNFNLKHFEPLTENQKLTYKSYETGKHLFLCGSAGSGKTFLSLYLALKEVLEGNNKSSRTKIVIVRSAQSSKDIGYLPGSHKQKLEVYESAYKNICTELFGRGDAYEYFKQKGIIEFHPTSFLRGMTLENSIIIVDEFQDMCWNEITLISSRVGKNSRIIYSGDLRQTDLKFDRDRKGHIVFANIIKTLPSIETIEFTERDIVRSGFCKEWIIACSKYEQNNGVSLLNM